MFNFSKKKQIKIKIYSLLINPISNQMNKIISKFKVCVQFSSKNGSKNGQQQLHARFSANEFMRIKR